MVHNQFPPGVRLSRSLHYTQHQRGLLHSKGVEPEAVDLYLDDQRSTGPPPGALRSGTYGSKAKRVVCLSHECGTTRRKRSVLSNCTLSRFTIPTCNTIQCGLVSPGLPFFQLGLIFVVGSQTHCHPGKVLQGLSVSHFLAQGKLPPSSRGESDHPFCTSEG